MKRETFTATVRGRVQAELTGDWYLEVEDDYGTSYLISPNLDAGAKAGQRVEVVQLNNCLGIYNILPF